MINSADIIILLASVPAAYGGWRSGFIKQASGLSGIALGILSAAYIYRFMSFLTQSSATRTAVLIAIMATTCFLLYDICTSFGKRINPKNFRGSVPEKISGAIVSVFGLVVFILLASTLFSAIIPRSINSATRKSLTLSTLDRHVSIPEPIKNIGLLIKPFESPIVFVGTEPSFSAQEVSSDNLSESYASLDAATGKARASVVKVQAWGCGSTNVGTGFLVAKNGIVTNAHVIAGADRITASGGNDSFSASAVWFDPNQDIAIIRTEANLPGEALKIAKNELPAGAVGAVIGYPGGGELNIGDVILLESLRAEGFDIYQKQSVVRDIYAIRGEIVPGNSGSPLITAQGEVGGLVFGHSQESSRTGYAINARVISDSIRAASEANVATGTGTCVGR